MNNILNSLNSLEVRCEKYDNGHFQFWIHDNFSSRPRMEKVNGVKDIFKMLTSLDADGAQFYWDTHCQNGVLLNVWVGNLVADSTGVWLKSDFGTYEAKDTTMDLCAGYTTQVIGAGAAADAIFDSIDQQLKATATRMINKFRNENENEMLIHNIRNDGDKFYNPSGRKFSKPTEFLDNDEWWKSLNDATKAQIRAEWSD